MNIIVDDFPEKKQRTDRQHNGQNRVISFLIKKRRARFHRESSYGRFTLFNKCRITESESFFCLCTVCAYAHIAAEFSLLFNMFHALLLCSVLKKASPEKEEDFRK